MARRPGVRAAPRRTRVRCSSLLLAEQVAAQRHACARGARGGRFVDLPRPARPAAVVPPPPPLPPYRECGGEGSVGGWRAPRSIHDPRPRARTPRYVHRQSETRIVFGPSAPGRTDGRTDHPRLEGAKLSSRL